MGGEHDQLTSFSNSACLSTAAMHFLHTTHTPSFLQKILKKGQNSLFSRKTRLKTHTRNYVVTVLLLVYALLGL